MTKKMKHFKRWLALLLAVVLVGGICIFSNSGSLWATEGVAPATEEAAETADTAEPTETAETLSETVEIVLSDEDSDTTEPTEAQPEEGTEAVVPEGGTGENVEGEEPVIKEETDSPDAEEVKSEKEILEEEAESEELLPEKVEEIEKIKRSVKVVSSLEGVEAVEEGTSITLTAKLTGFDDVEYEIQWQRSVDGTNWEDVDGANGIEYTFDITEETDGYLWRVGVSTSEA